MLTLALKGVTKISLKFAILDEIKIVRNKTLARKISIAGKDERRKKEFINIITIAEIINFRERAFEKMFSF